MIYCAFLVPCDLYYCKVAFFCPKYAVARCMQCLSAELCECIKQIHNARAICKPCMSPQFHAVTITKWIWLYMVNCVLPKKIYLRVNIKQIMNGVFCFVFSFVQWNKYFHKVKDEIFHSTQLCLIERNISSFTCWKYLYHCTHKHSLFVTIPVNNLFLYNIVQIYVNST